MNSRPEGTFSEKSFYYNISFVRGTLRRISLEPTTVRSEKELKYLNSTKRMLFVNYRRGEADFDKAVDKPTFATPPWTASDMPGRELRCVKSRYGGSDTALNAPLPRSQFDIHLKQVLFFVFNVSSEGVLPSPNDVPYYVRLQYHIQYSLPEFRSLLSNLEGFICKHLTLEGS